ncbi:hypothetical protein FISHEDRAFT_36986 [Fistulina hepatica ATCC 64428]|uniref:MYND-type domain-containing protein n=1 Tax=Fistulina hepatica ATCC 64428 TaxID=1128425 RepID=A0A0D7AL48_9AGAR|nr:hypothetical protein FISHEDRAFT_36986 [Fistulina hepatica ATCC 64428]
MAPLTGLQMFQKAEQDYLAGNPDAAFQGYQVSIKKIIKDERLDAKMPVAMLPTEYPEETLAMAWMNFCGFFKDPKMNYNEETAPEAYKLLSSFRPTSGKEHAHFRYTPRAQLLLKGMQITACLALAVLAWDKKDRATTAKRYKEALDIADTVETFKDVKPNVKNFERWVALEVQRIRSNLKRLMEMDEKLDAPARRMTVEMQNTRLEGDGTITMQTTVMSATDKCASCGKRDPKLMRCSACKSVTYCGLECQKRDWK